MSSGIDFDEAAARGIERIYQTPDVVAQRVRFLEALGLRPGEHVLDVGVGPGLLAGEIAAIVGEAGRVVGIDTSEPMLEMSRARCSQQPWAEFHSAEATSLPFEEECFDVLTATQVYEYVSDIGLALAEAYRVLRPGGRIWILDTDWDSIVWNTRDRARMRLVLDAWDEHLHDPHLPTSLGPALEGAGFRVQRREVIPILNTAYHPHTYSFGILAVIENFVRGRGGVSEETARDWASELRSLGSEGAYFFSLNRYLFGATRP